MSKRRSKAGYIPRSAGGYRMPDTRAGLCSYPGFDCDELALDGWVYCAHHHGEVEQVAKGLRRWARIKTKKNKGERVSEQDDKKIIEALEASGRPELAKQVRDERLAKDLAASGREDLAALMGEPTPAAQEQKSEGEAFLDEIRAAQQRNTTSEPGLLDL